MANRDMPHNGCDAISCIEDEAILLEIALTSDIVSIGLAAANRIDNQDDLAKVALYAKLETVRASAVTRLEDMPDVVKEVAQNDASMAVREAAVKVLKDEKALSEIASGAVTMSLRLLAFGLAYPDTKKYIDWLYSEKKENRVRMQEFFVDMAKNRPVMLWPVWDIISREAVKHYDKHSDAHAPNGCSFHNDSHADIASNVTFPPFPFKD